MECWRYYRVLRRRRWIVMSALLAALVVAIAANRSSVGDYSATADLAVLSTQQFYFVSGLPESQQQAGGASPPDRTDLALNLIRSRDVAERVVQRYHLNMRPELLQRRLTVQRDSVTNLIHVTAAGRNRAEAVTLANAVAETAVSYDREVQRRGVTLARELVEKQAAGISTNLHNAEDALLAFQRKNGVALAMPRNSQVASLQSQAQQVDVSLQGVEARLTAARARMSGVSATWSDPLLTETPTAQQLRSQLVQLEVALTSELAVHTDKYPTVVALKAKIAAIKDRLKTELTQVVSSEQIQHNPIYDAIAKDRINLETEKVALQAQRDAVDRALSAASQALPDAAQKQMEQSRLARAVDVLSLQYSSIQAQLAGARLREQEAQVLGSLSIPNLARGAFPTPFRGLQLRLTLASLLGLMGGVSLAFFLEYLDNTLQTPEAAERLLGIPTLVAIPRHNPPFGEAYRRLRVNLTALESADEVPVLAVTGTRPGGGSSTVVANLARAFARAGRRTIVVDTDFRRPTQHAHFGVANERGLVQVLAGEMPLADALVKTEAPNLWLLPSGVSSEESVDLLGAKPMTAVLSELKQRGDVILLDTCPAGAFPDALDVAPQTSGVLLVLDANLAYRGTEEQVKLQLARLGAKVLGTVLTKVRPDLVDAYVYQEKYYKTRTRRKLLPGGAAATTGALIVCIVAGTLVGMGISLAGHRANRGPTVPATIKHTGVRAGRGPTVPAAIKRTGARAARGPTVPSTIEHVVAQWVLRLPGPR